MDLAGLASSPNQAKSAAGGDAWLGGLVVSGIAEAFNAQGEMFSDARIQQLLRDGTADSSEKIMKQIISAADAFAGKTPQSDDMTVVVIKREESGNTKS